MLSELDDPTEENILRAKHAGKPCVVDGGLYLISTSKTDKEHAMMHSSRELYHVPENTW